MKKIAILSFFAALFCSVSCQHGLDNGQDLSNGLKVEAVISKFGDTRVGYTPQNSDEPYYIDAVWHVGDVVFGFDNLGQKFDFTVESVSAGVATLNIGAYDPGSATTLHAIYYPGKSSTDLKGDSPNYSLAVDLDAQSGELDGDSPVLMCATSAISAGSVSFTFNNETAIIGVTRFKLPADATVTSIELEGVVTHGTIAVGGGGSLELTPDGLRRSVTATGTWATTSTICNTAVYFASLPTTNANLVLNATDNSAHEYANVSAIAQTTIEAGHYYYIQKIFGAPVAEVAGVKYGSLEEAAAAAVAYDGEAATVTLQLLDDIEHNAALNLTHASKPVVLDLNGYVLTTTVDSLIGPKSGTLTITDSQDKVGRITSNSYEAVHASGSSTVSIVNCIIEGTMEEAPNSYSKALVVTDDSSNMTISGARIYTCGKQTALVSNSNTTSVTISDSELSSGISATNSFLAIANNRGTVTIESGSFYSKNYDVIRHTKTVGTGNLLTTIVNGGYFYSGDGATYCLRAAQKGVGAGLVLNGGYTNIEPSGSCVYYGSGKSLQDCDVDHVHATTGDNLNYTKVVTTTL